MDSLERVVIFRFRLRLLDFIDFIDLGNFEAVGLTFLYSIRAQQVVHFMSSPFFLRSFRQKLETFRNLSPYTSQRGTLEKKCRKI